MGGLTLSPGGEARRELTNLPLENLDVLQRMALKQRNTQAILEQAQRNGEAETKLLSQSSQLIRGLDDNSACRILFYLADRYRRTGRWPMAAETFQLLADRYPQHPLAQPALLWLLQYYSSGEAALRSQPETLPSPFGRGAGGEGIDLSKRESLAQSLSGSAAGGPEADRESGLNNLRSDRLARASALGKQIERTRPELFAQPALRFPLAAAQRNQGLLKQAEQFYQVQSRSGRDAWSACARANSGWPIPKASRPNLLSGVGRRPANQNWTGAWTTPFGKKSKPCPLKAL